MSPAEVFHRLGSSATQQPSTHDITREELAELLEHRIVARLARLGCIPAVVVLMDAACERLAADDGHMPVHPACAEVADHDYCREAWQLQHAELARKPEPLWHRCKFGRFCGLVPVVCDGRCVAALKLACRDTAPARRFVQQIELAQVLVENFVMSEGARLTAWVRRQPADALAAARAPADNAQPVDARHRHPQVVRALAYIAEHLADPKLSVHRIASHLGSHSDYLAHLFAEQIGERMSHYITAQRVALACELLTSTNWQIKRVAWACGFANPNWFSHVFGIHTGETPGAYRRHARSE